MNDNEYKKIFSRNLNKYMNLNGKNQIDLINDLGLNRSAVSTWCNGTRLPRMDKVQLLANYFGINRSDLIEDKPADDSSSASSQLTPSVKKIIDIMQELNEEGQDKLLEYGDDLLASGKYIKSCEDELVVE